MGKNENKTEFYLNGAVERLKTIGQIIAESECKVDDINTAVALKTIYGEHATVTIVKYSAHGGLPLHCHKDSREFIICVVGEFKIRFIEGCKVIHPGECVSLEKGVMHAASSLGDNGRLITVCVPCDEDLKRSMLCHQEE